MCKYKRFNKHSGAVMKYQINRLGAVLVAQLFIICSLCASHNASRFFPFLERSHECVDVGNQRAYFNPSFFYTTASTSIISGSTRGIPEVWGRYDLRDVIESLAAVQGTSFKDPIMSAVGISPLYQKPIPVKVYNKIQSNGLTLHYQQKVWENISVGAWIPVMFVRITGKCSFDRSQADEVVGGKAAESLQVLNGLSDQTDSVIRYTHNLLGFQSNRWNKSGVGDLDLYVRWNKHEDYRCFSKSIDINIQGGLIAPTGILSDKNNPFSVSVMGNGHWALYLDVVPEFELKQDVKVGLMTSAMYQFRNSRTLRLSVKKEPTIFSALVGRVQIEPGMTFKVSPYLTLENLSDGLHVQGRYTYLHHARDHWRDLRADKTIKSYLQGDLGEIKKKEKLSSWRSHYFTFQVSYDSKVALKNYWLDPMFYLTYDMPISANRASQTHQITFGVKMNF